nr:hypothetical protein [uncultured Desulfobulbus sp.]
MKTGLGCNSFLASLSCLTFLSCSVLLSPATPAHALNVSLGGGGLLDPSSLTITSVESFDTSDNNKQGLRAVLPTGIRQGDIWSGEMNQGVYRLTNTQDESAVRYYWIDRVPGMLPQQSLSEGGVSIETRVEKGTENSAAGILYHFTPETKNYYAFVVFKEGKYGIFQRSERGFRKVVSGSVKAFKPDSTNRLSVVPRLLDMEFYVNNQQVAKINDGTRPQGAAGIIGIGAGIFVYDNFTTFEIQKAPSATQSITPTKVKAGDPPAEQGNPSAPDPAESTPGQATPQDQCAGIFANNQVKLILRSIEGTYSGTLLFNEDTFAVKAGKKQAGLAGTFSSSGYDYAFEAECKGETLIFTTEGTVYQLKRIQ